MPPVPQEKIDEARALRASGLSWRKMAAHFGVSVQTVRRWVVPGVKEDLDARNRRWRQAHPEARVRDNVRKSAVLQAKEEGVDRAVVYERWGVPYRASHRPRNAKPGQPENGGDLCLR